MEANFSENTLFSFWFHSINIYHPAVDIYRNNQNIGTTVTDIERMDKLSIGVITKDTNIGKNNIEEADKFGIDIVVDDLNIGIANIKEVDVLGIDIASIADIEEAVKLSTSTAAENSDIGIADTELAVKPNTNIATKNPDIGTTNKEEEDKANKLGTTTAAQNPCIGDNPWRSLDG